MEKCSNFATANEERQLLGSAKDNDILPQDKQRPRLFKRRTGHIRMRDKEHEFRQSNLGPPRIYNSKAKGYIQYIFNSGEFDPGSG